MQKENIDEKSIKGSASAYGKKIAILISALDISDEEKEAWFSVLPKMSLEQIDRLVDLLETKYAHQKTEGVDKKLEEDLKQIQENYNKEMGDINKEAIQKIKELSKKIKDNE